MRLTPNEARAIVRALRYVNDHTHGVESYDRDDVARHSAEAKLEKLASKALDLERYRPGVGRRVPRG